MYLNDTRGTKSPNAKLTRDQVRAIYSRHGEPAGQIADEFKVHRSIVYLIWKRKIYRNETK